MCVCVCVRLPHRLLGKGSPVAVMHHKAKGYDGPSNGDMLERKALLATGLSEAKDSIKQSVNISQLSTPIANQDNIKQCFRMS